MSDINPASDAVISRLREAVRNARELKVDDSIHMSHEFLESILARIDALKAATGGDGAGSMHSVATADLNAEMARARAKFPKNKHLTVALAEELGECAQAYLQGRRDDARLEALQVACVAMRIYEEGDGDYE